MVVVGAVVGAAELLSQLAQGSGDKDSQTGPRYAGDTTDYSGSTFRESIEAPDKDCNSKDKATWVRGYIGYGEVVGGKREADVMLTH